MSGRHLPHAFSRLFERFMAPSASQGAGSTSRSFMRREPSEKSEMKYADVSTAARSFRSRKLLGRAGPGKLHWEKNAGIGSSTPRHAPDGPLVSPAAKLNNLLHTRSISHVEGRAAPIRFALIYDSPPHEGHGPASFQRIREGLRDLVVARFSGRAWPTRALMHGESRDHPTCRWFPEAVVCDAFGWRGGIGRRWHSVVFGGFAAPELAKRIDDAKTGS